MEPNFDNEQRNTIFKDVAVNTENLPYVPTILYELGLAPIPGTTVDGRLYIHFTKDERVARRGGNFYHTSGADISHLLCNIARSYSTPGYGARPRSRQTA